ncbi:SE-domain-containing protein [Cantharellus anzutake]|uniref:SE-domain-containing protein n=1 Tax=Cantharellus anzutake TaxID=1750568 RepID=UPI0019064EE3|nr:SE-domain-containing protein [Cantharellus anzutake]KAF8328386.1 SE-domain-containing protein [Cantharellus anzutake]
MTFSYDIIIIGAGIAGPALAHSLSLIRPKDAPPLRIALLERSLTKPDRIVGELLQPGGMNALKELGLQWCTEGIDAKPTYGYCVVYEGKQVHIPYPNGAQGRSFHHGSFVMNLREAASKARGVDVIEATVNELIECPLTGRVLGVRATRKTKDVPPYTESFFGELIIAADGCYSKFRSQVTQQTPVTKSNFMGAILENAQLPISNHGTVVLVPGSGPLPADTKAHVRNIVVPALPDALRKPVLESLEKDRLRGMPNSFLPAAKQGHSKEGLILIGDAWNMRHPLTGGGMTVALNDVVILTRLLTPFLSEANPELEASAAPTTITLDWDQISDALSAWHWSRKGLSSTINILSVALYDLFGADDINLHILRAGCFAYFERGGDCIHGPVSLLAGLAPSPVLLARHFFAVAFYSIYIHFTTPLVASNKGKLGDDDEDDKLLRQFSFGEYPAYIFRCFTVFWTACIVFGPLVWSEIRWW